MAAAETCRGVGFVLFLVSRCLVGFGRERIVSLGCALDLLCILDLWFLSALGHGKRRRISRY